MQPQVERTKVGEVEDAAANLDGVVTREDRSSEGVFLTEVIQDFPRFLGIPPLRGTRPGSRVQQYSYHCSAHNGRLA